MLAPVRPQLGEVFEPVHLPGEVSVDVFLVLGELPVVLLPLPFEVGPLLVLDLLGGAVDDLGEVLDELVVVAEVVLGDLQGLLVDLHCLFELSRGGGTLFRCSNSTPRLW